MLLLLLLLLSLLILLSLRLWLPLLLLLLLLLYLLWVSRKAWGGVAVLQGLEAGPRHRDGHRQERPLCFKRL